MCNQWSFLSCIKSWINSKTDQVYMRYFIILWRLTHRTLSGDIWSSYLRTDAGPQYLCLSVFCLFYLAWGHFISAQTQLSSAVHSWDTALCDKHSLWIMCFGWLHMNKLIYIERKEQACVCFAHSIVAKLWFIYKIIGYPWFFIFFDLQVSLCRWFIQCYNSTKLSNNVQTVNGMFV